jgi:hypothetical protein
MPRFKFNSDVVVLSFRTCTEVSFFLSYSDLFLPIHCRCRGLLLHLNTIGYTHAHYVGRGIDPLQILPVNTQHAKETYIHAPGGIRTCNHSKRAASASRLRPRGRRDQ